MIKVIAPRSLQVLPMERVLLMTVVRLKQSELPLPTDNQYLIQAAQIVNIHSPLYSSHNCHPNSSWLEKDYERVEYRSKSRSQ